MNVKAVRIFCECFPNCKLAQAAGNLRRAEVSAGERLAPLANDTMEISREALTSELLKVRQQYLAENPEAFLTLDHIKSNYDNWSYILPSVKNQTPALNAVSTEDFCELSEIMKGIRLPRDVRVHRAMEANDFNIGRISPEEFFQKYYAEGKTVTVPIYMSTSLDKDIAYRFAKDNPYRFVINMKVKKGTPAVYMEKLAPNDDVVYQSEEEINIIKNALVRFGKMKKTTHPQTGKPLYEVEAEIVGYKDVPPPPKPKFEVPDGYEDFLKAIMGE